MKYRVVNELTWDLNQAQNHSSIILKGLSYDLVNIK